MKIESALDRIFLISSSQKVVKSSDRGKKEDDVLMISAESGLDPERVVRPELLASSGKEVRESDNFAVVTSTSLD